jgi:hypothetical protein
MSTGTTVLLTTAGVLLIATALRDIFDALFHPGGKGVLSRLVMRGVWRLAHRVAPRQPGALALAGPIALLAVVVTWAALLVFGWTFLLWPHYDNDFADIFDLSVTTLTTLGFADPADHIAPLRIIGPLEALIGFGLLSASISWLLTLHPALSRRRSLAYELTLLREAERRTGGSPSAAEQLYGELTSRLVAVERDLVTLPLAYYFAESDSRFSLAASVPYLLELSERGLTDADPGVRLRAHMLRQAVDDFAASVAERFHHQRLPSTQAALDAYARDQLRPVLSHRPPAPVHR